MAKTTIKYSTALFVFLLAAGSFVLSYANLWDNAIAYGVPSHLAWIWPLLIDFALIVFSLAVVWASLDGGSTWWPWSLVGFYTVATVAFNAYHAPDNPAAQIVAVVAPVSLFLSFETLMAMLKGEVKKSTLIKGITQIEAELHKKRLELDTLESSRLDTLAALEQEKMAQLEIVDRNLRQAEQTLQKLTGQLEERRRELGGLDTAKLVDIWQTVSHIDPAHLDPDTRRILAAVLRNGGVAQKDIAQWAGVDPKTIGRDLEKCNGLVRK